VSEDEEHRDRDGGASEERWRRHEDEKRREVEEKRRQRDQGRQVGGL
jgi:hypothetical protein